MTYIGSSRTVVPNILTKGHVVRKLLYGHRLTKTHTHTHNRPIVAAGPLHAVDAIYI